MKNKLFLHIGTHKTGSTAIQKFLFNNKSTLKENGIYYPDVGIHQYAQHLLAFQLQNKTSFLDMQITNNYWKLLTENIIKNKHCDIVLSSEEFFLLDQNGIEKVREYFQVLDDFFDIKIVVYLRRQDRFLESAYNQQTKDWKSPRKEPIDFFLNDLSRMQLLYPALNYYEVLQNWSYVFGKSNILVNLYDNVSNYLLKSFIEDILGRNLMDYGDNAISKVNASISLKALEVIRLSKHVIKDMNTRKRIFKLANSLFRVDNRETLFSLEDRKKILSFFEDNNCRTQLDFFKDDNSLFQIDEDLENKKIKTSLNRLELVELIGYIIESSEKSNKNTQI